MPKWMWKGLVLTVAVMFMLTAAPWAQRAAARMTAGPARVLFTVGQTEYRVDGESRSMDAKVFVENDRTYVSVRYLATALGVEDIHWGAQSQTVSLHRTGVHVEMRVGSKELTVNGSITTMDVTPLLRDGRVYLPARLVAEALGYTVTWDAASQTITLNRVVAPVALKLATLSPLSGGQSILGREILRGSTLAVEAYQEELERYGIRITIAECDDRADPAAGADAAREIVQDALVIGVVGTLNSGVARAVTPVFREANLAMVSPSNTAPFLTQPGDATYNRLPAPDSRQGVAAARFAKQLGARTAYIIHDGTEYGAGLGQAFRAEAARLSIAVADTAILDYRTLEQLPNVVKGAVETKADILFFGGIYATGAPLIKELRAAGYKGAFIGGDGLDTPEFMRMAGEAGHGTYMISAVAPAGTWRLSEPGRRFGAEYRAKYGSDPLIFAEVSYDAASVILEALLKLLRENPDQVPAREEVAKAVRATRGFQGLTGTVTFDEQGDNLDASLWVLQYRSGSAAAEPAAQIPAW